MSRQVRIDKKIFVPSYKKLARKRGISTRNMAKNAGLSTSYAYHIVSRRGVAPAPKAVRKIGKGLNLSKSQINDWIRKLLHIMEGNSPKELNLAETINDLMRRRHIPVKTLIKKSGIDKNTLTAIRKNKIIDIDKITLARLANSFNLNVQVLINAQKVSIQEKQHQKGLNNSASTKSPRSKQNTRYNNSSIKSMDLANALSTLLKDRKMSINDLAKASYIDNNVIINILSGQGLEYATKKNLSLLANALSVPSSDLISAKHKSLKDLALNVKDPSRPSPRVNNPLNNQYPIGTSLSNKKERKPQLGLRPDVKLVASQMNHLSLSDVSIISLLVQKLNRSNH